MEKTKGLIADLTYNNGGVPFASSLIGVMVLFAVLWGVGAWAFPNTVPAFPLAIGGQTSVILDQTQDLTGTQCVLTAGQTLSLAITDQDQAGTARTPTNTFYFLDAKTGQLNGANSSSTEYGKTYTVWGSLANYVITPVKKTTECSATPTAYTTAKQIDTAISFTTYEVGKYSENTASNNISISSGGSASFSTDLKQSANYKHVGGVENKLAVYLNYTNASTFDTSKMSLIFDGVVCANAPSSYDLDGNRIGSTDPNTVGGTIIFAKECVGDFEAIDGGVHKLVGKLQALSGINPTDGSVSACLIPYNYYRHTIDGNLLYGAVTDDQTPVQTIQCEPIYIG